ncbi:MAG: DsbA family oxidoreductase [Bacteroidia bacterium]|nr:DsbA family oxidoreductase [Bacteroidia bacterium]
MSKTKIKIDIVSDVVCPWCYIGKRRLEKAIDLIADRVEVEVEFHPFELNPDMPKEGENLKAHLVNKFGGEDRYQQLTNNVVNTAAGEGLKFNFDIQKTSPNTRDAHRVIQFAKSEGKQLEVKEAFLNAYFEQGIDLSKNENLVAVATKAGLDPLKVSNLLNSDEGVVEVEMEERMNAQRGISGVPYFIINNKYGISGAQPAEVLQKALLEIAREPIESKTINN